MTGMLAEDAGAGKCGTRCHRKTAGRRKGLQGIKAIKAMRRRRQTSLRSLQSLQSLRRAPATPHPRGAGLAARRQAAARERTAIDRLRRAAKRRDRAVRRRGAAAPRRDHESASPTRSSSARSRRSRRVRSEVPSAPGAGYDASARSGLDGAAGKPPCLKRSLSTSFSEPLSGETGPSGGAAWPRPGGTTNPPRMPVPVTRRFDVGSPRRGHS